ncbi:MAG: sigma-70 family RNA polymerase sigma factor [Actinomycetota bacterium]
MRDDPTVVALVLRAKDGEQRAWDEIVERFAPLVWGICRRFRLSDVDAHDVGQNVWLRLVEHLATLREPAALPGWIATTTRRECIRAQRTAWDHEREQLEPDTDFTADEETTQLDQHLLAAERDMALRAAFAELSARCQHLLGLLIRDPPPPYAAISSSLQMPIGAIGPNRSRCLEKLRRSPSLTAFVGSRVGAGRLGT